MCICVFVNQFSHIENNLNFFFKGSLAAVWAVFTRVFQVTAMGTVSQEYCWSCTDRGRDSMDSSPVPQQSELNFSQSRMT